MKRRLRLAATVLILSLLWSGGWAAAAPSAITVAAVDVQVRDLLAAIARLGGADLVVDDSVCGRITLEIHELPLEEALSLVAQTKGLSLRREGAVYVVGAKAAFDRNFGAAHVFALRFIAPEDALAAAALSLGENFPAAARQERGIDGNDGENKINQTKNAENNRAERTAGNGRLSVDAAANALLFYGTDEEAAAVQRVLERLDAPPRQVSLEAKVVAIDTQAARELGVEWEWSKLPQYPQRQTRLEATTRTVTEAGGRTHEEADRYPQESVTRPEGFGGVISFGRGPEGHPYELYYAAKLNALIGSGRASVLARPNVMAVTGKEAVINIGGEVPVPTTAVTNSTATTSLAYREAGIILRYTPRVNADGCITAEVYTEVSAPVYVADVKAYRFDKRAARTVVRLQDGETMVIGGLIGSEESRSATKVPLLGDLPVLGRFFRNVKSSKSESEVMIFLTAHIVK